MLSTVLELAGFACLVAAVYLLAGLVGALFAAAPVFLMFGYALDDAQAVVALRRAVAPVRRHAGAVRGLRARRALAKAG